MMQHLGFPDPWVQWILLILKLGSSSILLNGVPGKQFTCKRGVRQGDPLSPLLFVLAAELLQFVINDALHQGLLSLPIPQPNNDFPIIQYADDTILVMEADINQLSHLKDILQKFALSIGLVVNYNKSSMIPLMFILTESLCLPQCLDVPLALCLLHTWDSQWEPPSQKWKI